MAEVPEGKFALMFEESKKFLNAMGLHEQLMLEILDAETDWEFIIKIDAMVEAAAKVMVKQIEIVRRALDLFAFDPGRLRKPALRSVCSIPG